MARISDLTTGSIGKKLIGFSAPIILSNLIQAVYGIVDMVTVGQFVGSSGMSAVSMGAQITNVILLLTNGLSNGGTVIAAQLAGQGRRERISHVLGTMLTFFTIIAVAITALTMTLARPLLRVINTPEVAFEQAVYYLLICAAGTIFVYLYNCMTALLRGLGDSRTPMIIVIISVILNIILDLLFIVVFHWGAVGAALATILCQMVSALLLATYIAKKTDLFDFRLSSFCINKEYLRLIVKIGLPQSIQFLFASSSYVFLSSLVNLYGVEASAAAGAAAKIQTIAGLPAQGMMLGLMTATAQNLAAGQPKRVTKGMGVGMVFSGIIGLFIFALCMIFPATAFRLFTPDAAVAAAGIGYLRYMAASFVMEALLFCMFGVISGSGYTIVTMFCGILSAFVARYSCAFLFSNVLGMGFNGIGLSYLAAPLITSTVCAVFLLTGKWKSSRVTVKK